MHKATSNHIAKRTKKFLMSKNPKINGNSFVGIMSKNLEKIPKIIPINNIHTVLIICLLRGIGFFALLISFKKFFILFPSTFDYILDYKVFACNVYL